MGIRLTKISPVEYQREAPALEEHLALYNTIVGNISRSKRFSIREEHLTTLSVLEEAIEEYLAILEWRMGGTLFLTPYWARYRAIKLRCLAEFKILHAHRRLHYPRKLTHHPLLKEVVGSAITSAVVPSRT